MKDMDLDEINEAITTIFNEVAAIGDDLAPANAITMFAAVMSGFSQIAVDMAKSLRRTAEAQEALVTIANADLEQIINENVEKGIDEAVTKRQSQRSFLGKAPNES